MWRKFQRLAEARSRLGGGGGPPGGTRRQVCLQADLSLPFLPKAIALGQLGVAGQLFVV